MKDWNPIQERYLRDAIPTRLGGLASDLSRIKSTAPHEANLSVETSTGILDSWVISKTYRNFDHTSKSRPHTPWVQERNA